MHRECHGATCPTLGCSGELVLAPLGPPLWLTLLLSLLVSALLLSCAAAGPLLPHLLEVCRTRAKEPWAAEGYLAAARVQAATGRDEAAIRTLEEFFRRFVADQEHDWGDYDTALWCRFHPDGPLGREPELGTCGSTRVGLLLALNSAEEDDERLQGPAKPAPLRLPQAWLYWRSPLEASLPCGRVADPPTRSAAAFLLGRLYDAQGLEARADHLYACAVSFPCGDQVRDQQALAFLARRRAGEREPYLP